MDERISMKGEGQYDGKGLMRSEGVGMYHSGMTLYGFMIQLGSKTSLILL
jgi:hypothetical protein